jgi:hypothetical protein
MANLSFDMQTVALVNSVAHEAFLRKNEAFLRPYLILAPIAVVISIVSFLYNPAYSIVVSVCFILCAILFGLHYYLLYQIGQERRKRDQIVFGKISYKEKK